MKILFLNLSDRAMEEVSDELGTEKWIKSRELSDAEFTLWDVTTECLLKVNPECKTVTIDYCGRLASINCDDFELIKIL